MNEPTTTISGNLTADPELRYTAPGQPVANFSVAITPRYLDRTTGEMKDGEALFMRCAAWGDLAGNVVDSLSRGQRVVVTGRLRQQNWEHEGQKRASYQLQVDDIGPSLRWATAKVTKTIREATPATGTDPWATAAPTPAEAGHEEQPPF